MAKATVAKATAGMNPPFGLEWRLQTLMAAPDDSPESRDRLSLGGPAGPGDPPVPRFVDATLDNLQALGMSPSMVERFVHFWKRYGLSRALILVAAVTMPLWRYVWIPTTLSAGVETWAEGSGATLTVGDWSSDWFDIAVTGEEVRLETTGPYLERAILAADAVEIDWSLLREMRNTLSRAKALVFGSTPADEPIHRLRIDDGVLHFEHLLTGRWNWQDAVESRATSSLASSSRLYRLPLIEANKLRIAIVEHLPGDSGGGLIEQKTATLHLDDVKVRISDLMLPDDDRDQGGGFQVQGRTADGRFALDGRLNLARWMAPGAGDAGVLVAKELAKTDSAGGSPMSRGVKNVGRGFKRLFGGGKR